MSIYMYILAATVTMEQSWLVNLRDTCSEVSDKYKFEEDEDGKEFGENE